MEYSRSILRVLLATGLQTAIFLATQAHLAAQAASQGAPPKCDAPEYRQFDFWVGHWNVTNKGKQAGVNQVTLEEDGCLVYEHWTGAGGGTGQSFNFYSRQDRRWHQVWVSNGGQVLDLSGEYAGGKMVYGGETVRPDGKYLRHRLTFYENPDRSVRQHWETSADGGTTWQTGFDGLYRRRGK